MLGYEFLNSVLDTNKELTIRHTGVISVCSAEGINKKYQWFFKFLMKFMENMIFVTKQENAFNVGETDVRYIKKSNNFEIRQYMCESFENPWFSNYHPQGSKMHMNPKLSFIFSYLLSKWLEEHFFSRNLWDKMLLILDGHIAQVTSF